ncbi:MAG TPA: hypothetical protein VFW87_27105 [Pirellulales bacterium]|nr:hypothetical protein [Pirellulales bacterium]
MSFTVVWIPAAEQNLAEIWLAAEERAAVTFAAREIDSLLKRDPDALGDARFDSIRSFEFPPIGVDFEVLSQDRLVYVLSAWSL